MKNKILHTLFDLTDRVIIVAGGAGQIGFSLVTVLADSGAKVILADIDIEMAKEKLVVVEEETAKRISIYQMDVADKNSITDFIAKIKAEYSKIYGLINCFHYKGNSKKLDKNSTFFSDFENYPLEAWNLVHDINLRGTFLLSQKIIPLMEENGGGVIVNFSSTYGIVSPNKNIYGESGINSPVAYATSKAGIIQFTKYAATHLAEKNIRVNVLSPGGVQNNQSEEFIQNYCALTPLKRMALASDYQGAILFLISDASAYMTGANLVVDGGWTSW